MRLCVCWDVFELGTEVCNMYIFILLTDTHLRAFLRDKLFSTGRMANCFCIVVKKNCISIKSAGVESQVEGDFICLVTDLGLVWLWKWFASVLYRQLTFSQAICPFDSHSNNPVR